METDSIFPDLGAPITCEDDAAALVEAFVDLDDTVRGCLFLLLCDPEHRPVVPVVISDIPTTAPVDGILQRWFDHLGQAFEGEPPGIVFARARPGQSFVLDQDREWHNGVIRSCAEAGIPLLHSFVRTQHAVVPLPAPVTPGAVPPPLNRPSAG